MLPSPITLGLRRSTNHCPKCFIMQCSWVSKLVYDDCIHGRRPECRMGGMPNALTGGMPKGRNAERAQCQTLAGRMPKRSTSRNRTKISVAVTVWYICVAYCSAFVWRSSLQRLVSCCAMHDTSYTHSHKQLLIVGTVATFRLVVMQTWLKSWLNTVLTLHIGNSLGVDCKVLTFFCYFKGHFSFTL